METEPLPMPDFLTVEECQKICRFKSPAPIRRAIKRGDLQGVNLRQHHLLVQREALLKWIMSHQTGPKPEPLPIKARRRTHGTAS